MESSETTTQSPYDKKFRVRDLAYMAGIVDGEGCITGTRKTQWPQARVQVTNRSKELIDWCHTLFGGYVRECPTRKPEHAVCYEWVAAAKDITQLLTLLLPHLKIKQKQARFVMILRAGIERKWPKERLEKIVVKIHTLNHKGR
jgi:hypothetical protein